MEKVIREICVAGAVIDTIIKASFRNSGKRKPKEKVTPEGVKKNNDRLAILKLTRLINMNFYPGDFHCTLTYANVLDPEEAKHQLNLWLKRMRREYEKQGKEFYWVAVTEFKNHRIHHHVVMNYIDQGIIAKQWKQGHVRCSMLDRSRNYRKLAEYLIKETQKTFREPDNATKRRWSVSRNLKRPIIKREWVSVANLWREPKPLKGYKIDYDTLRYYEHPTTKLEHLEYMQISTDPVPRIKTWRKGKIVNREEGYIRAANLQMEFENIDSIDVQ